MSKTNFDWKNFIKNIAVLAIPVALQNLLATTATMIDTIMIAPLGEATVGAVGLCAQYASLMFSSYWGFVGGGVLFFSQYWGAKNEKGILRTYGTTMIFMMLVAAFYTVLTVACPQFVMGLYTDKEIVKNIGAGYLRIVAFSYPFQIFSMCMSAMLRSTERVKIPLFASIISVFTNIVFNYVLIGGHLGIRAMEEKGAATATLIASIVNVVSVFVLAKKTNYTYLFRVKEHFKFSLNWIKEYLLKCLPIICNELLIGIGFTTCNVVLGRQSVEAIAALAVFRTFEGFVIAFFTGFSNASSLLVAKCVGAGELETAYERAKRLVLLCGICILSVCVFILIIHSPILSIMGLSGLSFEICRKFLLIYSVAAVVRMCNWVLNDTFRSSGDTAFGTLLEIISMYLLVIPSVILSGQVLKLPTEIVFMACYIDEPIRLFLMVKHLYSAKWIKPVTKEGKTALELFKKKS